MVVMTGYLLMKLIFIIVFISVLCVINYKLYCKMIDVLFQSNRSYKNSCFCIALFFIVCSIFAYDDFAKSVGTIWFFFLMLFCAALFVYLGVSKIDISQSQTVITANFSEEAIKCLLKVLKNEQERLKTYRNQDSECDLDIVNDLIINLKNLKSKEATFEFLEAVLILSALDHEVNDGHKSNLSKEELRIARVLDNDFKAIMVKEFGDEILYDILGSKWKR